MSVIRSYMLPIAVRQTAATVAGKAVWAMRSLGIAPRTIYIRRILVNIMFDGTPAGSQAQYQLVRFRGATHTGGSALTVIQKNVDDAATAVTDARFLDTGLTDAGVTYDAMIASFGGTRQNAASNQYPIDWPGHAMPDARPLMIKDRDGLALLLGVAAVIGDGIQGFIEWDEHGGRQ